jgi:hypothetical protein
MRDWHKEYHCRKGARRRYETHFDNRGAVKSTSSNDRSVWSQHQSFLNKARDGRQAEDRREDVYRAEKQTFAQILVRSVRTISRASCGAKILPRERDFSMNFLVDAISLCRAIAISGRLLQPRDLAASRADDVPLPSTERRAFSWARTWAKTLSLQARGIWPICYCIRLIGVSFT